MSIAENLFLLTISMLTLESFLSIHFTRLHIILTLTGKSLNSFTIRWAMPPLTISDGWP